MGTVCRKLNFGERWTVRDSVGRKRGMLVAWRENVQVQVISSTEFCIELQVIIEVEKKNVGQLLCMLVEIQMREGQ